MAGKVRVILFGAGLIGRQVLPKLARHVEVLAFADNDTRKHGTRVSGVPVIAPDLIRKQPFDLLLISSTSINDINEQVLALGIAKDSIVVLGDAQAAASGEFPWDAVLFLVACAALVGILVWWFAREAMI